MSVTLYGNDTSWKCTCVAENNQKPLNSLDCRLCQAMMPSEWSKS